MRPAAFLLSSLSLIALSACMTPVQDGATRAAVIYGEDDRLEFYELDADGQRFVRESVVAFIPDFYLDETDPTDIAITAPRVQESGLCRTHSFARQPSAALCTGTLIDDDLVLTAGHCLQDVDACNTFRIVFDYRYDADRSRATITEDAVYGCSEVLVSRSWYQADWAIIRLDRPVSPERRPAPLAERGTTPVGVALTSSGFSYGTPVKTTVGPVLEVTSVWTRAELEVGPSASGSSARDASGNVVGVVALAPRDEERDTCTAERVIADGGAVRLAVVTYGVWAAVDALCETPEASARLCDPGFVDPHEPAAEPDEMPAPAVDVTPAPEAPAGEAPTASGCDAVGALPTQGNALALVIAIVLVIRRRGSPARTPGRRHRRR